MNALKKHTPINQIPPEVAQNYITEMLEELSGIAKLAGLRDLASLLRATMAASRVDMELEIER